MSNAQPPPRRGAYTKHIQSLHKDQFSSTQVKNNQELDLLDDIVGYMKKRGAIERQYAESMLKLSNSYQSHRIAPLPDVNNIPPPTGKNHMESHFQVDLNVFTIWRIILEENEKLCRARLATVHMIQDEVEKDCKLVRNEKQARTKKTLETLHAMQKDLQNTISEVDRTKRIYFEDESRALDVRDRATDADDKARGRKKDIVSFFQSSATLKRHAGKLSAKQEEMDIRSTGARNDYILALAAANAHQERYFKHDLQEIFRQLESSFYEKVSTYFDTLARVDLLTSSAVQVSSSSLRTLASKISRGYNFRCYATIYSSLAEHVTYVQECAANDSVTKITPSDHDGGYSLDYEAKQCASKLNQAVKTICAFNKQIQACQLHQSNGLRKEPNDSGGQDLETKIHDLLEAIRNAEVEKAKAEARLAKLREGGIAVDQYIDPFLYKFEREIQSKVKKNSGNISPRKPNIIPMVQIQIEKNSEDGETSNVNGSAEDEGTNNIQPIENNITCSDKLESISSEWDNDAVATSNVHDEINHENSLSIQHSETNQKQVEVENEIQPVSFPQFDVTCPDTLLLDEGQSILESGSRTLAVALFDFTSQNPDELDVVENEEVTILMGQCDEDGWLMAVNSKGERGYVPENYISVGLKKDPSQDKREIESLSFGESNFSRRVIPEGVTTSSMEVIHELEIEDFQETAKPRSAFLGQSFRTTSLDGSVSSNASDFCKAMYDYDALRITEVTFEAGDIIHVLNRDPNGTNDGWWLGEVRSGPLCGTSGLFPSIVVKECYDFGDDSANEHSVSSPLSNIAPPSFSPPQIPPTFEEKIEINENIAIPSEPLIRRDSVETEENGPSGIPALQFDLVEDLARSPDELNSPDKVQMTLDMEIVVTAPTPLIQSPVSDEEEQLIVEKCANSGENQPAGIHTSEKDSSENHKEESNGQNGQDEDSKLPNGLSNADSSGDDSQPAEEVAEISRAIEHEQDLTQIGQNYGSQSTTLNNISAMKANGDCEFEFELPPEELQRKHLIKLESMKESQA